jgi:hypothetical protein
MPYSEFNTDEYYTSPQAFIERRNAIKPVEALKFNGLLGVIAKVVLAQPEYFFLAKDGKKLNGRQNECH